MIEDDAVAMSKILEKILQALAFDYLLSEKEIEQVVEQLKVSQIDRELRNMYAASDREDYAANLLIPIIENTVKQRSKVILPSVESLTNTYTKFCMTIATQ